MTLDGAQYMTVLTPTCPVCDQTSLVTVKRIEFIAWQNGTLLQNAMPLLSVSNRELLMTGFHDKCFPPDFRIDQEG